MSTLRPPIGEGHEGKIFAVALSPDSRLIAAGGWSVAQPDGTYSIYVFDRASGQLLRRIGGLRSILYHLKFSPDGTRLAVALRSGGLRVFQVPSGVEERADSEYGDSVTGVDFDKQGRLVTSSLDKFIRLYDHSLKLIKKSPTGSEQPYAVRFSPDGSRIAVGFMDAPRVDVLSGQDLGLLFHPDLSGLHEEESSAVAWSRDGARLCIGTRSLSDDKARLRCWKNSSAAAYLELQIFGDAVYDLEALPDGRWAFAAQNPIWGILSDSGQLASSSASPLVDFRTSRGKLLVDQRGGQVQFGYLGKTPRQGRFSVEKPALTTDTSTEASLQAAATLAPALEVTGWDGARPLKVNGKLIRLGAQEKPLSLAIAPGSGWFLLGTERYLRRFDAAGNPRWNVAVPGEAQQVNVSGDGKIAVAAYKDGTIRWYRAEDGTELLALFPHADGKRWIAFTPNGRYEASPGGESLLGWQKSRGLDSSAEFISAAQLKAQDHSAAPISQALFTTSPQDALQLSVEHSASPARRAIVPATEKLRSSECLELGLPFGIPAVHVRMAVRLASNDKLLGEVKSLLEDLGVMRQCR